ncbi:MAG: type II toxin-antitoxin system HicB family antitoxin [Gammaproteobacteria bacterium]|nr:type II toxin-antitoxin system HicB family antitoxin [Gammaproteobacteria bacterium]NNJ84798.1 type II toxin-antitoxin system HicB family antitoxin [Gammaproteobacteria bacterium]
MNPRYSILIRWSDEDQCYIASLPEFGPYAQSHGRTYEEALTNAKEALALLIEDTPPLPEPQTYRAGKPDSRLAT